MSENPKLSVIVPVFNAAKYLHRCVDSILIQNFTDFELLLIDDGSQDDSSKICDDYAEKDYRVKVLHKENGGVSSARNIGLELSKGKWISFVDADDYISYDFYDDIMEHSDADVIQKSYAEIISSEQTKTVNVISEELESQRDIELFFVRKRNNALWDKIIKKELIGNSRFDTRISIGEDLIFFLTLIHKIKRYCLSNMGRYYYVKNENSAMSKVQDPIIKLKILFENIDYIKKYASNNLLGTCIVAQSYIPRIILMSSYLSNEQTEILKKLCKNIKWSDLSYVSFKHKIKLFFDLYYLKWKRT